MSHIKSRLAYARRAVGTWLMGALILIIVLSPPLRKHLFFSPGPSEPGDEFNNLGVDL